METSTNGAGAAVEAAAAGREDQLGVAELVFGAGGRAAPEGVGGPGEVPDPELVDRPSAARSPPSTRRRSLPRLMRAPVRVRSANCCAAKGCTHRI